MFTKAARRVVKAQKNNVTKAARRVVKAQKNI
jgi:hypothetical protein